MESTMEQKFKEMEAEMNRFEQEISVPKPQHPDKQVIIGAGTYSKVQRHLAAIASGGPPPPPPPPSMQGGSSAPVPGGIGSHMSLPASVASRPPPPPPPGPSTTRAPDSGIPNMLPPPPPPPAALRPAFVPHQVRGRAPPPPPPPQQQAYHNNQQMNMPPRPPGGPPGMNPPPMGGPPPHHMMGGPRPGGPPPPPQGPGGQYRPPHPPPYPNMGGNYFSPPHGAPPRGPHPHHHQHHHQSGPQQQQQQQQHQPQQSHQPLSHPTPAPSGVIEKPKVVYSAPPVRIKKQKTEDGATSKSSTDTDTVSASASATTTSSKDTKPAGITPGIELNVPVEQVHMEKAASVLASGGGGMMMQMEGGMGGMGHADLDGEPMLGTRKEKKEKKKKYVRTAAGQVWEDHSLAEWDTDDFRLFCGDLGNEVTDDVLARAFSKYPSFQKSKIVRDKRTNKTRGFGFVSFKDPNDFVKAMREMNGKYVGNRPIKLRKSTWKERQIDVVKKKEKEKKRLGLK